MKHRTSSLFLAAASTFLTQAHAQDLYLTRSGQPTATIAIAKEPVHAAVFAARELQYHVHKITGATLPIVADDVRVAGNRILVGESAGTRQLGLATDELGEQEYLIQFRPNTLVLLGRDDAKPVEGNVSVVGDIERTEGRFGRSVAFNGKDTAVTVRGGGFNDEEGTVEAWVWLPAEPQPRHNTILRLDGTGPWTYHILSRAPKTTRIHYVTYDGKTGYSVTSRELTPGWHHARVTYRATEGKQELFVDGVSQGTTKYTKTTCWDADLQIGGISRPSQQRTDNPFRGRIDEVRISTVCGPADASILTAAPESDAHTAVLLHFDEASGTPTDASGIIRPVRPPDCYDDQATSYAAHDFLERFCDVRWYGPTEIQMVHPTTPTLKVSPRSIRRAPAFKLRSGHPKQPMVIGRALWNNASTSEIQLFWARLKGGGEKYACNHSFYGYYNRFWKKDTHRPDLFEESHPDWFAQGYDGKPPQMCFSNEGFITQVVQDARTYFDGKPADPGARALGRYFGLVPMDNNRQCKCSACQAQMNEDERNNPQFNNGLVSDLIFGFVNEVAREVGKTHPDQYLSSIAYHDYAYYPRRVKLEPNVSVQLCLTVRHWWAPCMKENDLSMYREWVANEKGKRPLYLWLYYCFPELNARNRHFHCFPGFSVHTHAKQIKMFAADGIRGATTGGGRGEQVDMYVTLKLFDDPSLDVDELLDEFFTRYYGAAAQPMKRIHLLIEQTYGNPANYPEEMQKEVGIWHQTEEIAWDYLGTEERMAELGTLMAEARRTAQTDVEKRRVAIFDKGVWEYLVEGRRKYLAKKAIAPEIEKLKAQTPPEVRVPRQASTAGDASKIDWSSAAVLGGWRTVDGYETKRKLEARAAHDGEHLYLQLQDVVPPKQLVSRSDVWSGDDWELFFAASRAKPYYQFGVAPNGKHRALAYGTSDWDSGAKVVSDTSAADRWTVRLSFPLHGLIPGGVRTGATLYANLYRATAKEPRELLAWSPNFVRSFHELSRLGELILE